ncbi:o-succinylbenzoate synthase [Agromyces rhizosphaerae]|uniref:o-succinylbenzoate synthase n=1 Tax=Agromyces rhizosphaerae TaxID=88374 RepID=A0A9W6CYL6_9MICO|nr:o-succinylbenzoate synthase [Agromyces rhizosphaerae]GLI26243.1 o-succinylbenzoate synthase [Agromyces rhizosphaerae]
MRIEQVVLHRVAMPLVRPFETSFGTQAARDVLLVHVRSDVGDGWGECVAGADPLYSSEYVEGAAHVLRTYLVPALLAQPEVTAESVAETLAFVAGHRMAKAALEAAVLDAQLRAEGMSMGTYFGAEREWVDCGVSVGIAGSIDELLDEVAGYIEEGYRRIKLKVKPGWDLLPVNAVREELGPDRLLQVDANSAYRAHDIPLLAELDAFRLVLIEQPFPEEDIATHAALAAEIETPVCLDESILDADVALDAIERGATSVINIKAGRVGGYLEAVRVHDLCRAVDVSVWCGGMLETGVGRAANVALAALPGFTLPGDTSASRRYFADDLTEPFELGTGEHRGQLRVPDGPGTGVTVRDDLLRAWATREPEVLRRA